MNPSIDQGLLDLIADIRPCPAMYIGCLSVIRLRAYIDGYIYGRGKLEGDTSTLRTQMLDFQEYVRRRQHIHVHAAWERMLEFSCGTDESGLKQFWNLWDDYVIETTGQPPQWDSDLYKRRDNVVMERLNESNLKPIGQGLLDLLADVRKDPAALLGRVSVLRLALFIFGCVHAESEV